jgi:hypothetical protein
MMNFPYRVLFLGALTLTTLPTLNGCKQNNPQTTPNQQQGTAAAPAGQSGAQSGAAGMQPNAQPGSPAGSMAPQTPPPPTVVELPSGTLIRVRLDQDIGSKISQTGDSFSATVDDAVVVNGQTVIPGGAHAEGTVVDAKPLGRFKGGARLELRLERVRTNWGSYPVATGSIERAERGKGRRSAEFIGGGGALGTVIGALAGGKKGALIGGLAGAGAGTAGSAFTGNSQIFLPTDTLLSFSLEHSVHVTE